MTYEVIKTVNGRRYRYLQETYREGGKVRTRNHYIGPVDPVRRRGNPVEAVIERTVTTTAEAAGTVIERTAGLVQRGLDALLGENKVREAARVQRRPSRTDLRRAETPRQERERLARESREYAERDRINAALTAPSISMDMVTEIAAAQSGRADPGEVNGDSGEGSP